MTRKFKNAIKGNFEIKRNVLQVFLVLVRLVHCVLQPWWSPDFSGWRRTGEGIPIFTLTEIPTLTKHAVEKCSEYLVCLVVPGHSTVV
jgi:hypothetical protein